METVYGWLLTSLVLGLIPGALAYRKGYPFVVAWLLSVVLSPLITLVWALFVTPNQPVLDGRKVGVGMKTCPHCAEPIRQEARVCRYCGRDLGPASSV